MKNHYNQEIHETFSVDKERGIYDFDQKKCMLHISRKGKKIYGYDFNISDKLYKCYAKILYYAVDDKAKLSQVGVDPQKGLLLMGPAFSGKTAILQLCKDFFPRKRNYQIYHVKKLTCDFAQRGYGALTEVMALKYPICLDGIGDEKEVKHFGNSCDIIPEIVEYIYQHRYEFKHPMLHITTRLSASQLEKRYGPQFRVMLKELMNGIVVDG